MNEEEFDKTMKIAKEKPDAKSAIKELFDLQIGRAFDVPKLK